MRKPSWLFDSRSVIDPEELDNTDINFWRIGDGLQIQNKNLTTN
jgi:UDPglucose 6-dehydrogenase